MSRSGVRGYVADVWDAWNDFWFSPTSPSTLSAIRVLAGAMLFYTHPSGRSTWRLLRPEGWLPPELMQQVHQSMNGPDRPAAARLELLRLHPLADRAVDRPPSGAGGVLPADGRAVQPHDGACWPT